MDRSALAGHHRRMTQSIIKSVFAALTLGVFAGLSIGCATAPQAPSPLEALMTLSEGRFETRAGHTNSFAMRNVRFAAPGLNGQAFYSQLNTGPERRVYRQRISLSTLQADGSIRMQFYALNDPSRFVAVWNNPALLSTLTMADLKPGFEAVPGSDCDMIWRPTGDNAWQGMISPSTCRVQSARRGTAIGLEAETNLSPLGYAQTERGYGADGTQLFGTAPGELIQIPRLP
jgi:CpeT/CpcT family (DUF1001)